MRPELFISWRYLATKRKERFISLISLISILGIAIGVMALIVVIGVMTGFDRDLRDKIVGNYSHITITSFNGITDKEYDRIAGEISSNPHITGVSPYLQGQVLIKEGKLLFAAGLKGIDPRTEPSVTRIGNYLLAGNMDDLGSDKVIIGKELALYLGVGMGSKIATYSPFGKERALEVAGIFSSGMYDYDLNLVFTDIGTARGILGMNNKFSAIAVKLDDLNLAGALRSELSGTLGVGYNLKTWMEANQNFFAALKLEKLTMFIILTLIILVASFNIISTLVVMVVEKTRDIGILKAIGMNSSAIKRIFRYEGMTIGILGILIGTLGGTTLCALLKRYQFIKLPQDIYYIDKLPVSIEFWPDIALIMLAAIAITLVSTIYPASKAAKLNTVEALRYE